MHREPARQRRDRELRQQPDDAGPVPQVVGRHEADACPLGQQLPVGDLVIGAHREALTRYRQARTREAAPHRLVAVVADQAVREQVDRLARRAGACQVVGVRGGDDLDLAELLRDQRALRRPHHAHRDVGLATQQVRQRVRRHQLDLDARLLALQAHQHGGQQPDGGHVAGADAHGTGRQVTRLREAAREGQGAVLHLARGVGNGQRGGGGRDPAAGALEQRRAELGLELGDVAAQRRLLGPEPARRAHQAAGIEHGQKALDESPVEPVGGGVWHAKVYGWIAILGNCRMASRRRDCTHRSLVVGSSRRTQ